MSSDSDADSDEGAQVRISLKLASSVQDRSLEVATEPIAVPADIGRKGLSAVLNHLLGRSTAKDSNESDSDDREDDEGKLPALNFEFILAGANNRLLRKGVEKEARQYGVSLEEALKITYFPASQAPDADTDKEELPDWVSCLSYEDGMLVSGCYDGSIHIYRHSESNLKEVFSGSAATGPIKALKTTSFESKVWIASASLDHTLNIHTYDKDDGVQSFGQYVSEGMSCAVSSLDFAKPQLGLLASGDCNGTVSIWNIRDGEEGGSMEAAKKRKTATGQHSDIEARPTAVLSTAHSQLVSGLSWGNHSSCTGSHLITGSWDHSIKLWDVAKQDCLLTLNGARVISCLDSSYHSEGVLATGHPDCTIRLWDVRVNAKQQSILISDSTFRPSHKAWVSGLSWSKTNAYQLASTSHDGNIKVWDIRSSNPLHTVSTFPKEEKGMCILWEPGMTGDEKQHIFAGGSDCTIRHFRI